MADQISQNIARDHMVDSQIRPNHVHDTRVISAMRALPREAFAPAGSFAYADADIPLGQGRYLVNPMVTARLAQLVLQSNPAHALVVGAGSGYLAAVLGAAGVAVVALEEETRLDTGALAQFGTNVEAVTGPLAAGWPAGGPYDAIVIEGAVPEISKAFAAQLVPGGRVIAVIAEAEGPGAVGRVVVAEASGTGFAEVEQFDVTPRLLPQFRRAPAFAF
ncbi:protein-L-isoaspartate O-methyltransferase family protein [Acidocella aromatica]|uniref:Protein-L-isoaspartate O-methyltransferase n=1 Tax=Acidocella aromatica TaxID=1303579 RepID=A0A840VBP8_9PROT|nr:protein-L-isoaspartate(D-aspartate) O-methyltransferase [Acidocella aromatica]MBB5373193.1 protein-L-isoaspartate(D-aspartate) O-methyltransferase [Acidocella aromatica]